MLRALTTRKRGRSPSSGTMLRSAQLILGQAGSGKTRMVAKKVISLAQKEQGVLVITGSEDGRQKILDAAYDGLSLGRGLGVLEVHTLGSLSKAVVSEFGGEHHGIYLDHGGGVGDRMVQGRAGVAVFLQQHLDQLPLQRLKPRHNVRQALLSLSSFFLRLQGVGIEAHSYVKATQDETQPFRQLWSDEAWALEQEKAQAYMAYQELKAKAQCFDGLDLVLHARSLLCGVGEAGRVLGERHPHLLIDDLHTLPSPLLLPMLQALVAPPPPFHPPPPDEEYGAHPTATKKAPAEETRQEAAGPSATKAMKAMKAVKTKNVKGSMTLLATADPDPQQWVLGLYGTSELPPPSLAEQFHAPLPSPIHAFTQAFPTATTLSPPPFKTQSHGSKKRQRGWEPSPSSALGLEAEGSGRVQGVEVRQWVFREQQGEMAALAHNVHHAVQEHGVRVCVVVPKWRHVSALLPPLQALGLHPHCPAGGDAPLLLDETTLVRPLLSLLTCLSSWSPSEQEKEGASGIGMGLGMEGGPCDSMALHHVLTLHFQHDPHTLATVHRLLERCRSRHESLWHTLNKQCASGALREVGPLLSTLRALSTAQHHLPTSRLLLTYLQDTGLLSRLESPCTSHEEMQARALTQLLAFINTHLETRHQHDHRLCGVLPGLLLYRDYPNASATLSPHDNKTPTTLQHQQHHHTSGGKKHHKAPPIWPPVTVLPWSSCWSHEGGPYDVIFLPHAHHDALPPKLPPQHLPLPPFLLLPSLPPSSPLLSPSTLRSLTPHLQHASAQRTLTRLLSRLSPSPSSTLLLSYSRQLAGRKREARPSALSLSLGLTLHHLPLAPPSPSPAPSPPPLPLPPSPLPPSEQLASPPAPLRLSYSSVSTYRRCPLAFYYSHVLHLSPAPTPLMLYGRALHAAVAHALPLSPSQDTSKQRQDAMHAFQQEWAGEGSNSPASFISREERQQLEAQAHDAIASFIQRYAAPPPPDKHTHTPPFLYPWHHPLSEDQGNTAEACVREPVLLEHRFEVPLSLPPPPNDPNKKPNGPRGNGPNGLKDGPLEVTLSGVLDRVDLLHHPPSSPGLPPPVPSVWLVEYKSCVGATRSMSSLASGPHASLQLRLYALALSRLLQAPPSSPPSWLPASLPRPQSVARLVLESIEDGRTAHQILDPTDTFDDVLSVLREVGSGVQRRAFTPSPSPHNCAMCPHHHTCPASATHTHTQPPLAQDPQGLVSTEPAPIVTTVTSPLGQTHEAEQHPKHQQSTVN